MTLQPPFVAFKEWHLICEALVAGRQQIILRKGGIAEGRRRFTFQHRDFFLFPTFYHAQYENVRIDSRLIPEQEGTKPRALVTLSGFCRLAGRAVLTRWEDVERLEPFHLWKNTLLRERFDHGDRPGLHLAVVRTYRLEAPMTLPFQRVFGGCRSWIPLPLTDVLQGSPSIPAASFRRLIKEIDRSLCQSALEHF